MSRILNKDISLIFNVNIYNYIIIYSFLKSELVILLLINQIASLNIEGY